MSYTDPCVTLVSTCDLQVCNCEFVDALLVHVHTWGIRISMCDSMSTTAQNRHGTRVLSEGHVHLPAHQVWCQERTFL